MKDKSQKKVEDDLRSEALYKIFHLPEWLAVVRIEEDFKSDIERKMIGKYPSSTDEYTREMIYMKGQRDAIQKLWGIRHQIVEAQKKKEDKET